MNGLPGRQASFENQQGIAVLGITLALLVAMTVMTAIGARVAVNSQRVVSNSAHSELAFQAAEAALDNVLAYLNYNRAYVSSTQADGWLNADPTPDPRWEVCVAGDVTPPCGDGTQNIYPSQDPDPANVWRKYGAVPNLVPAVATGPDDVDYQTTVYLLTGNIADAPVDAPDLGCLNLGLSALVPSSLASTIAQINGLLDQLLPGMGIPADLCLPLNFSGADVPPTPSSANPTIRAVAYTTGNNARAASATLQQDFQTVSRFVRDPLAPLIGDTTIHLYSTPASDNHDVRIWGNPRPPTTAPFDFSMLQLNDVLGLNITNLLGSHLGTVGSPLEAATLAPLLNLTVEEVLALDWNVTFPLTIWSDQSVQLKASTVTDLNVLKVGRTCAPPFDAASSNCVPLSLSVAIKKNAISDILGSLGLCGILFLPPCPSEPSSNIALTLKLPDIQDPVNFGNVITGLLDTGSPVAFPDDLFEHIFGVPVDDKASVLQDGVLLADCGDLSTRPSGFYRLESTDCEISGVVGSREAPMLLIVDRGDVSMAAAAEFYGVIFMLGPDHRLLEGVLSNAAVRPSIFGAAISTSATHVGRNLNIVYDRDVIRRAGYTSGHITRLPGSWSDQVTGP